MTSKELLVQLTLEEKATLCSGKDFWHMAGVERLGIKPVMVTDGPHGLRKQAGSSDHLGINESVPAVCFPTASATASTFDRELMYEIGQALGEECLQEQVSVLLGPGANIKRSPLCGRNFEYISEDPYVTGELAASIVNGIQSKGVGTSLKHFAANNQETRRMVSNSVIDERALREIYLAGFEAVVQKAQPWTVMCSYNLLNETYLSENKRLLTDILRNEWGFEGAVVTDWGAVADRVKGIIAGLDLEMPGSGTYNTEQIINAVNSGSLSIEALNAVVERILTLLLKGSDNLQEKATYNAEKHRTLARRAAAASCVLLKNDGPLLPIASKKSMAVIGAFAKTPRYQGAGSSKINPLQVDNACDELLQRGYTFDYADGYSLAKNAEPDNEKIKAACELAKGKDMVLLFAGLPDEYESEGYDRTTLNMPESHTRLIDAVAQINNNVILVLQCGSPVAMPFSSKVKSILLCYLGGEAGAKGCVDVLSGDVNPSGRLAETFVQELTQTPCYNYFPGNEKSVEYRESIFVGYRFYDKTKATIQYPFGYGLSYTSFEYSDIMLSSDAFAQDDKLTISFTIKNIGDVYGGETPQLYVGLPKSKIYRAVKELKAFDKVFLQPNETARVSFCLQKRDFSYYNTAIGGWAIEGGQYHISVGASSRDIRLEADVNVLGDDTHEKLCVNGECFCEYFRNKSEPFTMSDNEFEALLGHAIPPTQRAEGEPFTMNSTIGDILITPTGKMFLQKVATVMSSAIGGNDNADLSAMASAMMMDIPLRVLGMMGGQAMTMEQINGLIMQLNQEL